jgi:hypothetical protein
MNNEIYIEKCPICGSIGESQNIKICQKHQKLLDEDYSDDLEVGLVEKYCLN